MNAVIYCRVSTADQTKNLSLPTQHSRCVAYCTTNEWTVVGIFRDEGKSAKTLDRPEFQKMIRFCNLKQNAVKFVVVHDLSRFSRDMGAQAMVLAQLERGGVRLRSVMEIVDETPAGRFMRNMCGAVNQFDNDRKAERTKLGMQRAVSIGRWPFTAPIGYLNLQSERVEGRPNLIPDPERAPIVRKAFELFATGTQTKRQVLRTITTLGLTTRAGKPLSAQTFQSLLANPIYAGWIVIPTWGTRDRGSHEPIVSDELFHQTQELLDGRKTSVTAHDRNNPDFPLRVFVRCGRCGTPITGAWAKGKGGRYAYYWCRKSSCRGVRARRDDLEGQFAALLESLAPESRYIRLFQTVMREVWNEKQADARSLLTAAKRKLTELGDRKNRLVDLLMEGKLSQQDYDDRRVRLQGEIESAETAVREADLDSLDVDAVLQFAERLVRRPKQLWLGSGLAQRQRLQCVFFPDGLTFTNEGFLTPASSSFFNTLARISDGKSSLASPTGFEPVLSP